jgi:Tfp pilus assembly protein PilE
MYRRQRGVTFLGWVILLIPVAIVVYAAIRIVPVYLNYMRVAKSLDEAAAAMQGIAMVSDRAIRTSLEKRFDIESIDYPNVNDVTIRRDGTAWVIEAKYSDWAPLFANISLEIDFDKTAEFGG